MKKLLALSLFILIGCMATFAQSLEFVDVDGNAIPDGSVIRGPEKCEIVWWPTLEQRIHLKVKNKSSIKEKFSIKVELKSKTENTNIQGYINNSYLYFDHTTVQNYEDSIDVNEYAYINYSWNFNNKIPKGSGAEIVLSLHSGDTCISSITLKFHNDNTYSNGDQRGLEEVLEEGSLPVIFENDSIKPWEFNYSRISRYFNTHGETTSFSFKYESPIKSLIQFYVTASKIDSINCNIYIDGEQIASYVDYKYVSKVLEAGEHKITVEAKNLAESNIYSRSVDISEIYVQELKSIDGSILKEGSAKIDFVNDDTLPWFVTDSTLVNSGRNAGDKSSFLAKFKIETPSIFSFESLYEEENLKFTINDYEYCKIEKNSRNDSIYKKTSVYLEPGEYVVKWDYIISNYKNSLPVVKIKNFNISNNCIDINVTTPGSLGKELINKVGKFDDVELLRITGSTNQQDWRDIKLLKNLISLDLSNAVLEFIPNYAFENMNVQYVKLPNGIGYIGKSAFKGSHIYKISIPASITAIREEAFKNTPLRYLNFEENSSLQDIGYGTFYECNLEEVIIPNSVKEIGNEIFYNNHHLRKIIFSDNIIKIPSATCYNCDLTEIHLPKHLKEIEYANDGAFAYNWNLKTINFPNSLEIIGRNAFIGCGLDSLILPNNLSVLQNGSFCNNEHLKYIRLNSKLDYKYFSDYAFKECYNVEKIACTSVAPLYIPNDVFTDISKSNTTLAVPSFSLDNYINDAYWFQFQNIVPEDMELDYWYINAPITLLDDCGLLGKPNVDIAYGGELNVMSKNPMNVKELNIFNGGKFIVNSECNITIDTLNVHGGQIKLISNNSIKVKNINIYTNKWSYPINILNENNNIIADSINVLVDITGLNWYFFTPVHDIDISKIRHSNNGALIFRYYDGANRATEGTGNSWKDVTDGKLLAGHGYIFQTDEDGQLTIPVAPDKHAQIFNTNDFTQKLNLHETEIKANKSWNYVGNPYPSYFDVRKMDFTAPITVWTGSTYRSYSIIDDNYVLRANEGFFVQKPDDLDSIVFHKEGRMLEIPAMAPSSEKEPLAELNAERFLFNISIGDENGNNDETRVVINNKASLDYEIKCDASKFMSIVKTVPQIFTTDSHKTRYSINERPLSSGEVTLGYKASVPGTYTIKASRADGEVILIDKKLDKSVILNEEEYKFYSEDTHGTDRERFVLMFNVNNDATGFTNAVDKETGVFVTVNGIVIKDNSNSTYNIYTLDGKKVKSGKTMQHETTVKLPADTYVVKTNGSAYKVTVL